VSQQRERIASPDEREVRLVFEEESWVEIRDRNDQTIFSQLNQAGTTRRIRGVPPLQVVVGNAQGVRMTYAGRDIDLARHTKIDVARLTLE
jgi:cytoskeleton protein RodZ